MLVQTSTRTARRERYLARTTAAMLASASLNAGMLTLLARAGAFGPPSPGANATTVALAAISAARWEANRKLAAAAPLERPLPDLSPPARARDLPVAHASMRIVEVAPSLDARRPKRARFLADRNNTVPHDVQLEGRSRPQTVRARPSAGALAAQGIPEPGEEGDDDRSSPGRTDRAGAEDRIAAARLALAPGGDLATAPLRGAEGQGAMRKAGRFDPRLLPLGERYEEPGSGGPTDETLPGVARGDATMLNTWAFKHADFFRRVHDAIKASWDPNRAWDAHDPHDQILGRSTRQVLVDIVLDPGGRLKEVRMVRGSGLDFFDRECVRAVEAASPFPNPPRALVNGDGLVVLRRYGLVFSFPEGSAVERLLR